MNPIFFAFMINRMRGDDNATAARKALVGGVVAQATGGIASPVARAVTSGVLTQQLTTPGPVTNEDLRRIVTSTVTRQVVSNATAGLEPAPLRSLVQQQLTERLLGQPVRRAAPEGGRTTGFCSDPNCPLRQ